MSKPVGVVGSAPSMPQMFPLTLKSGEFVSEAVPRIQKTLREGRHLPDVEVYEMAEWMQAVIDIRNASL